MSKISKKKFVLLVDNYPSHLKLFTDFLRELKIGEILTATCFDEAKKIIDQHGHRISLLITDYQLGEKNGGDLIRYAKVRRKKIKTVIITVNEFVEELSQKLGTDGYIDKNRLDRDLKKVLKSLGFLEG